jgi:parallel beta-helix repeat protein
MPEASMPVRSLVLTILFLCSAAVAGPSGGPYGPIETNYELPQAANIFYVAADGDPDSGGESVDDPTTIETAITQVVTGDAIVMRGGIYRTGGLLLNQGITIQPYADEHVVFKGTRVATEWEALSGNVWRTKWDRFFPARPLGWWRRNREGMRTPLHRFNNDMVFVDGKFLMSAGWEGDLDADTYYIDYENGYVYIGVDPSDKLVEITAHDGALVRTSLAVHGKENDGKGPTIRGITFTQYAYRCLEVEGKKQFTSSDEPTDEPVGLSDPETFGKEVVGTVLENLTISYCSRVAGYFRGDGLVIRNSLVSDTSTEGIYVIGSSDVLLEKNIILRNNIEQLTGYYPSAVKIFNQTRRVTFRDNLIMQQPYSNGVWYDVGNREGLIVDNWIEGAIDGFFFEISDGATVAGNVFVNNDKGIRVLNAANVHVYNNTFFDSQASFERNERSASGDHFGWHASTGPDVDERDGHVFVNNLLVASETYRKPLLNFEQPVALCSQLDRPMASTVDGNVYVRSSAREDDGPKALVRMSPAETDSCSRDFNTLASFREATVFESDGRQLDKRPTSLFRSPALGNYQLLRAIPSRVPVPAEVRDRLGWRDERSATVGAYPGTSTD